MHNVGRSIQLHYVTVFIVQHRSVNHIIVYFESTLGLFIIDAIPHVMLYVMVTFSGMVESAIGARRIRTITKGGMLDMTN